MKFRYEREGAKEGEKRNKEIGLTDESYDFHTHTHVSK